jgi:hypothetical protein
MDVIRIAGRMIRRLLPKPYQLRRDLLMNRRIPSRESTIELLRSRILGERPSTNGVEHVILVDGVTEYTATTTEEERKMKWISRSTMTMLAGCLIVSTAGCITGTNTFSRIGSPATQYCSIDERTAPVFDIPSTVESSGLLSIEEAVCEDELRVSLKP